MADVITFISRQILFFPFLDVKVVTMVPMKNIFVWLKDYRALLVCLSQLIYSYTYSHNSTFFSFSNFTATSTFQRNKQMFLLLKIFCHFKKHFGMPWHSAYLHISNYYYYSSLFEIERTNSEFFYLPAVTNLSSVSRKKSFLLWLRLLWGKLHMDVQDIIV